MKRIVTIMTAAVMGLALFGSGALAGGHEWHDDVLPHAHVMLLGVDVVGQSVIPGEGEAPDQYLVTFTFRRCVELTASDKSPRTSNGALPTPAHHHSVHTGNAGGSPFAQGALYEAGNWVIPLAPFAPFTGCDDFQADGTAFPFPFPLLPLT